MTYKLGHACQDENGKFTGGKPADQTGREVYVRNFYEGGWNYVLRFKDATKANNFAKFVTTICNGNYAGYNQAQRNTLLAELEKVNMDASKLKTKCNTDCSAFMTAASISVGVKKESIMSGNNSATTSTLRPKLVATGLVEAIKYTKGMKLYTGDIVLKEGTHTACIVSGEARETAKATATTSKTTATATSAKTVKMAKSFKVYKSAADAIAKKNAAATYESGSYEVKKTSGKASLLTNSKHTSGGWVVI